MQNLDLIAEELFNKIRGRFPSVTIGDAEGNVTNEPKQARYFDFDFMTQGRPVGKVSVSLDEKSVAVVYGENLVANEGDITKNNWYDFLKELRMFAKKRTLTFDTRDITKSNLNSRDYKFLAKNRGGDDTMNESKMYGTSRVSYQDFDGARLMIKHTESIDQQAPGGRAKKVGGLYIESAEGERFKYPYKHLTGARAMARHVAEGGNAYDEFGKHIVSMSEEMNKLRKFKTYMGRSAVMAESLSEYMDVVKERIATVKKTLESLQKPVYYKEAVEGFETAVLEEVPSDVAENWIDQLTIKQFNEELADVFPYIYKLVSEATRADEITPDDLDESGLQRHIGIKKYGKKGFEELQKAGREGASEEEKGAIKDKYLPKEEQELEQGFEEMMGQFAEGFDPDEFEGEFDYDAIGDDGEEDAATVTYKATINDMGRPVVDPKSIEVHASGNNPSSKLGYDVQGDTEMQDMKELLQMAQEDADEMWDSRDSKYAHGESVCSECGKPRFVALPEEMQEQYETVSEEKQKGVDGKVCWKGYKRMGTKMKGGKRVDNCVKIKDDIDADEGDGKPTDEEILALADRYKQYEGGNGDSLLGGYIQYMTNTGVPYDSIEEEEWNKWREANPDKEFTMDVLEQEPENFPISKKFRDDLFKMYKGMPDEDDVHRIEDVISKPKENAELDADEGNAYAHKVRQAKMNGKKKGDEIDGPDGEKIKLEKDEKTPLGEFILSYFDRETGQFPKGETAVLTMVEKDYGEEFIEPAKAFIAKVYEVTEEYRQPEVSPEFERMRELAGLR